MLCCRRPPQPGLPQPKHDVRSHPATLATRPATGGSSGWQAPEQLIARSGGAVRQTRSMDIFSLGCVMHYCLTGGLHPFGGNYERDTNIMRGQPNLSALAGAPEAANLVGAMLSKNPAARPTMGGVLSHPFWWGIEQRLQFLVDVSDRCACVLCCGPLAQPCACDPLQTAAPNPHHLSFPLQGGVRGPRA
jgi:serine/threonine protein kinase